MQILQNFNKAFESKARLGIMSVLMVNDEVSFIVLKDLLSLTDGNLATHLRALEEADYIAFKKGFIGRKPSTVYNVTLEGKKAFEQHLTELERFIKGG